MQDGIGRLPVAKVVIPGCDGEIVLRIGADGLRPCVTGRGLGAGCIQPVFRQRIGQQRHPLIGSGGGFCCGLRIAIQPLGHGKIGQRQRVCGIPIDSLLQQFDCFRVLSLADGDLSELQVCR